MTGDPAPPGSRSSSSGQDAVPTSTERAVRLRPERSILKALSVRPEALSAVSAFIAEHHYLGTVPATAHAVYAVRLKDRLVGAGVFTPGARHSHRLLAGATPDQVGTLARFCLLDTLPPNAESRTVAVMVRLLRRDTSWKLLLTYADPAVSHRGVIYQAAGFLYLGLTLPESYVVLGDGTIRHPRSVFSQHGSNSVGHLRRTGIAAARVRTVPKHRYAVFLDPSWRWRLRIRPLPYPRGQPRGPPAEAVR
jgi:hypothetical protein